MRGLRIVRDRLRGLFSRAAVLHDIDEELRSHIDLECEANERRGMAPAEARRAALAHFGSPATVRDDSYDVRGGGMLETVLMDIRYGLRVLRRSPSVTLSALVTWALGIGAIVAVFSVIKPILIDPLPVREPDRLFRVYERLMPKLPHFSVAAGNFASWRDHGGPWSNLTAWTDGNMVLLGGGEPERERVRRVTEGYFATYGLAPRLGRDFTNEENVPDHEHVAILSDGFWQRRFGGDPGIVGRDVSLDGHSYTVVGVMAADLPAVALSENPSDRIALWVPAALGAPDRANHGGHSYNVVGRLAPGATIEQLRTHLADAERGLAEQFDTVKGWEPMADGLADAIVGDVGPSLLLLAVAVAFVLLIACANVASLLLGRASVRVREIALRAALGAGRGRIVRQLATESLVLSIAGGALGLVLAIWGVDFLVSLGARSLPGLDKVHVDLPLLGFAFGASVLGGLVVSLAPGLHAARGQLHAALKDGGRTNTGHGHARVRRALVVIEVAACLLLVVGAGLLLRSLGRLVSVDPGFEATHTIVIPLDLPRTKYTDDAPRVAFAHRALEEIGALPGARSVAVSQSLPFLGDWVFAFSVVGRPPDPPGKEPSANFYGVSPSYFAAMGIRLISGRAFTGADVNGGPGVLVVNERVARQFFPAGDALGSHISFDGGKTSYEIIGVVADVKQYGLAAEAPYQVYNPYDQAAFPFLNLVVKTDADPASLGNAIRARIASIDPDLPVGTPIKMADVVSRSVGRQRFAVALLGVFAAIALLMAVIGIYGVISDAVTQRTHEIGVRMALGARRGTVLRLMMGQGLAPAALGVVLGLGAALATTHLLKTLLYGIGTTDVSTLALAVAVTLLVAVVASYLPARRATRVDPMVALRAE